MIDSYASISLCTAGVSYPLSLYRDIHKLSRASGLALIGMLIIVASVLVEGPHVPEILKGDPSIRFSFMNSGIFQAIGVISFAFGMPPNPQTRVARGVKALIHYL